MFCTDYCHDILNAEVKLATGVERITLAMFFYPSASKFPPWVFPKLNIGSNPMFWRKQNVSGKFYQARELIRDMQDFLLALG